MKTLLLGLVLHFSAFSLAQGSLDSAQRAQIALGPDLWSRVLRIKNENPRSRYPATVYATVFEFAGILWFYTDTNGTQSFSLRRGQLDQDKTDCSPLLRQIDSGFVAYEILPEINCPPARASSQLLQGCFIDSLVALKQAMARGEFVLRASLLSYYGPDERAVGHTVLAYETVAGCFVVDSAQAEKAVWLRRSSLSSDARDVANQVAPIAVKRARWVPIPKENLKEPPPRLAAAWTDAHAETSSRSAAHL